MMVLVKIRVNLHTIFFGIWVWFDEDNVCEDTVVLFRVVTIINEAHKLEDG